MLLTTHKILATIVYTFKTITMRHLTNRQVTKLKKLNAKLEK